MLHFAAAALLAALALAAPSTAQSGAGSYIRIDRPERVRSFFAAGAEAWIGRRVHVHLPASAIAKAEADERGALCFRHRGVRFLVSGKHPALARYNRRTPRGAVLCVKGVVRRARGAASPRVEIEDFKVGTLERW
jgi:hypothetical protein